MSNDKTLATVKHGGCVQLGDGMAIESRARELLAHEYAMSGSTKRADKIIAGFDCAPSTEYAVRAIKAALSAQPSPATCKEGLQVQPSPGGQDALAMIGSNLRSILSLCKPDGQSISKVDAANIQHEARHALQLLDLAARQPVGEPVMRVIDRATKQSAPSELWGRKLTRSERQCWAQGFNAAPPAQAVDLADFKALYRAYVRLLESGRDRIIDLGGTCDPVDVMEANDVDLQAARRVMDSQAVGNG